MPPLPSLLIPPGARRGPAAAIAAIAALSLSACAQPSSRQTTKLDGEAGKVQAVVDDFGKRADDDDAKGICAKILTPQAAAGIAKGPDCASAVQRLINATDLTVLDVDTVKITGTTAVATIIRPKRASRDVRIVLKQQAAGQPWKIAAFGNAAAAKVSGATAGTTPAATTP